MTSCFPLEGGYCTSASLRILGLIMLRKRWGWEGLHCKAPISSVPSDISILLRLSTVRGHVRSRPGPIPYLGPHLSRPSEPSSRWPPLWQLTGRTPHSSQLPPSLLLRDLTWNPPGLRRRAAFLVTSHGHFPRIQLSADNFCGHFSLDVTGCAAYPTFRNATR